MSLKRHKKEKKINWTTFCSSKSISRNVKIEKITHQEKIFAVHITDKGVLSMMNWQISMRKVDNLAQRIGRRLEQVLF